MSALIHERQLAEASRSFYIAAQDIAHGFDGPSVPRL